MVELRVEIPSRCGIDLIIGVSKNNLVGGGALFQQRRGDDRSWTSRARDIGRRSFLRYLEFGNARTALFILPVGKELTRSMCIRSVRDAEPSTLLLIPSKLLTLPSSSSGSLR
jgi:hypothetical protein